MQREEHEGSCLAWIEAVRRPGARPCRGIERGRAALRSEQLVSHGLARVEGGQGAHVSSAVEQCEDTLVAAAMRMENNQMQQAKPAPASSRGLRC